MENLSMILGGEDLQVTKRDGSQETVHVCEFKISEMPRYSLVIDDEAKMAEMLCGKEAGWADSLARESLVAVIEKGDGLNQQAGSAARDLCSDGSVLERARGERLGFDARQSDRSGQCRRRAA